MIKPIGIILIIVGAVFLYQGLSRKDSIAGQASEFGTEVANTFDGGARAPRHMVSIIGGGVLMLVGTGLMFRKRG